MVLRFIVYHFQFFNHFFSIFVHHPFYDVVLFSQGITKKKRENTPHVPFVVEMDLSHQAGDINENKKQPKKRNEERELYDDIAV